jgi:hypothetical protein
LPDIIAAIIDITPLFHAIIDISLADAIAIIRFSPLSLFAVL